MKAKSTLVVGMFLALVLVLYMVTYQVKFNQIAVVTTFGAADNDDIRNMDAKGAGLYWKWPWPIQDVRRYDARVQILEDRMEEQQTQDKQGVVVNAFVCWRIDQPLDFFRSLRNSKEAISQLRARLRDARAEIAKFSFDQLTNADPQALRLAEAEEAIRDRLQKEISAQKYGLKIEAVGIKRILLPQSVTPKVADRMIRTRERMAQLARSEGKATADAIRARAEGARAMILARAQRHADAIRALGDQEASVYYKEFAKNEDLAIFIRRIETMKKSLSKRTIFVLDAKISPFDIFENEGKKDEKSGGMPLLPPLDGNKKSTHDHTPKTDLPDAVLEQESQTQMAARKTD